MSDSDFQAFVGELIQANILINKSIWMPNEAKGYVSTAIDILKRARDKYLDDPQKFVHYAVDPRLLDDTDMDDFAMARGGTD